MMVDEEPEVGDVGLENAEDTDVDAISQDVEPAPKSRNSFGKNCIRQLLARWRVGTLALALVASTGITGSLYVFQYRADQQIDGAAARAAIKAASEGTVAVLSYGPDTVDHDLAVAYPHLTGEFLRYYRDFAQHFVAPGVRQQQVKASASVLRAGVSQLHADSAIVLLFIHQTTATKDKPEAALTSNGVRVTLTKVDGSWLISRFEPV
jgi:Mce-associated membrane protein